VKYKFTGPDHENIFYSIYKCLDKDNVEVNTRAKFSYTANGELHDLPVGCPPPIIP